MDYLNKERRFYTVNDYYQQTFGSKVLKVPLNGNFTCPNRDGLISKTGCIYCSESGSGDFAGNPNDDLLRQYHEIFSRLKQKWPSGKAIAYFQANTNTYGPLSKCQSLFEEAIQFPDCVGLSIATRPDCLEPEMVEYLIDLSNRTHLTVELGLQTIHDETANWLNRGHSVASFDDAVMRLSKGNIHLVAHIINGLPNETEEMMLQSIRHLNQLPIHGVKIHMLHVMKKTILGHLYELEPFELLSLASYAQIVSKQIAILRSDIVVYRVTGDAPKELLIEPKWTLKKFVVQNEIDKYMRTNHLYQGVQHD